MMDNGTAKNSGSLKISRDVVESIIKYTLADMDGVASLAPKAMISSGWFIETRTVRPVSVEMNNGVAVIDIRICVQGGANIPELSRKVQQAVKDAVQNMTGIIVSKVNLHIAGVAYGEKKAV